MTARDFGVEDDPYKAAEEEVAPYRRLTPEERFAHFLDLLRATDAMLLTLPREKLLRVWRLLDDTDDPGRWWERVPCR